ncbi:hypothetical protein NFC73_00780 [Pseudarthrobacter sp. RMG13]|uniref:Uncharacterized protein n=1 Tax=Pseudarthrobacter humi TaxID=2952523 RepID=A0ABT1LK54_9MICC|nr:hypothetical protein [Pseudarthrobacter humi]MCP8998274.1 hypothetical protein [Pseudarthrobacter humi]
MGRSTRVSRLETKIHRPERPQPFDWEAFGEIGVLTRDCIALFLTSRVLGERLEGHSHQLMRIGSFALDNLVEGRTVTSRQRESVRQLMADPDYRGFGWTEVKHPKALQLYRMCAARGWLNADNRPPESGQLDAAPCGI